MSQIKPTQRILFSLLVLGLLSLSPQGGTSSAQELEPNWESLAAIFQVPQ